MRRFMKTLALTVFLGVVGFGINQADAQIVTPAPPFELQDLDGNTHKLEDFLGAPLMINFFATWCGPCHSEAPALKALAAEYEAQGVQFLQIAPFEDATTYDAWVGGIQRNWVNRHQTTFPILIDATFNSFGNRTSRASVYRSYGNGSIPYNVVINANGHILYQNAGYYEGAIRNALDDALTVPPGKVRNVMAQRGPGNFVTLNWDAPSGTDLSHYEITWGTQPGMATGFHTLGDPTATSVDVQVNPTTEALYFEVTVYNMDGAGGPTSEPARFMMSPFVADLTATETVMAGETLKVDYSLMNGGSAQKQVTTYALVDIAGTLFFVDNSLVFHEFDALPYRTDAMAINDMISETFLEIPFPAGQPMPAIDLTFYFGTIADGALTDLVSATSMLR